MLIPFNTDAPVYHFPYGRVGLISGVSALSLWTMVFGAGPESWLLLTHGGGIRPWEWVTSLFVVPGFLALILQCLFLWSFGLVVEGKVGWQRLLGITLGPAIFVVGLEQLFTLGTKDLDPSSSVSRMIYILAGVSLIWAPVNELTCYGGLFWWRGTIVEVRIWIFAMIFFGVDAFLTNLFGTYSGPPAVNVVAAVTGMVIGYWMLQAEKIDCEGADLLTVMSDAFTTSKFRSAAYNPVEPEKPSKKKKKKTAEPVEEYDEEGEPIPRARPSVRLVQAFDTMVAGGNAQGALNQVELIRQLLPDWLIPGEQLKKLIDQTQQMKLWQLCIPLMEEYAARFEGDADTVRLRLAKILVDDQQRPRHALRVLSKIPPDRLGPTLEESRKRIEMAALEQIEDGVLELESEGWTPDRL